MKVLFFCNKMPDLCGAFLHDIDLALELQRRGHDVAFMTIQVPKIGFRSGTYRGFTYMHYTAGEQYLNSSHVWICPHSPIFPDVRKINVRGYNRPIIATCHFDGNYTALTRNYQPSFHEMILFINSIMENNYRKNIVPWPPSIHRTEIIRPIMHRDKIVVPEPFRGDYVTLINANMNKGVYQFVDIAKAMPQQKFLGILPYYGERQVPPAPNNITWIPFDDDIRNILKQTRILIMPSYYESFGRVAVEAMVNGIPVLYSKPNPNSVYPGGSTEGVQAWIGDAGIACERESIQEWVSELTKLADEDTYAERSAIVKAHIESMNLFSEASRIAGLVEEFARTYPAPPRQTAGSNPAPKSQEAPTISSLRPPTSNFRLGVPNGRLRLPR